MLAVTEAGSDNFRVALLTLIDGHVGLVLSTKSTPSLPE